MKVLIIQHFLLKDSIWLASLDYRIYSLDIVLLVVEDNGELCLYVNFKSIYVIYRGICITNWLKVGSRSVCRKPHKYSVQNVVLFYQSTVAFFFNKVWFQTSDIDENMWRGSRYAGWLSKKNTTTFIDVYHSQCVTWHKRKINQPTQFEIAFTSDTLCHMLRTACSDMEHLGTVQTYQLSTVVSHCGSFVLWKSLCHFLPLLPDFVFLSQLWCSDLTTAL